MFQVATYVVLEIKLIAKHKKDVQCFSSSTPPLYYSYILQIIISLPQYMASSTGWDKQPQGAG